MPRLNGHLRMLGLSSGTVHHLQVLMWVWATRSPKNAATGLARTWGVQVAGDSLIPMAKTPSLCIMGMIANKRLRNHPHSGLLQYPPGLWDSLQNPMLCRLEFLLVPPSWLRHHRRSQHLKRVLSVEHVVSEMMRADAYDPDNNVIQTETHMGGVRPSTSRVTGSCTSSRPGCLDTGSSSAPCQDIASQQLGYQCMPPSALPTFARGTTLEGGCLSTSCLRMCSWSRSATSSMQQEATDRTASFTMLQTCQLLRCNMAYFDLHIHYTPASTKLKGGRGYTVFSPCPSVCGAACFMAAEIKFSRDVRLWTEWCPLCIFHNTSRIHFIFAHLINQLREVRRVLRFLKKFKIWIFGNFLEIVILTLSSVHVIWMLKLIPDLSFYCSHF